MIEESATVLLELQFDGSLSNGIVGFYKAFYANNTKYAYSYYQFLKPHLFSHTSAISCSGSGKNIF